MGCFRTTFLVLTFLVSTFGAGQASDQLPVEAFGNLPLVTNAQLSPDGSHVAIVRTYKDRNVALITPLGGGNPAAFQQENARIRNIFWITNERALIAMDSNAFVRQYRDTVQLSRLVSVSTDGKDIDMLMRTIKGMGNRQRQGSNLASSTGGVVPQHQELMSRNLYKGKEALVEAWTGDTSHVFRVSLRNGAAQLMKRGVGYKSDTPLDNRTYTKSWMVSPDHNAWLRWNQNNRKDALQIVEVQIDGGKWQQIDSYGIGKNPTYGILGFGADPYVLYVTANREDGPSALFEYDLKANKLGKMVYGHPDHGTQSAIIDDRTGKVLAALYQDDQRRQHVIDPDRAKLQALIDRTFDRTSVNRIISSTDDRETHVVVTSGPSTPETFYIVNPSKMQANVLGEAYPDLANVPLGKVTALTYEARDGLPIRAYLTTPPGTNAENLPTVILPHGGPHSRDLMEFDYLAQFLANRGYAVLQPNFRGSTGYGAKFLEAGYGEWGGKMQDDVTDGARHLIDQGIADPERMCIMGWSYGGYAALMGGVKTPDLYRCIISINGVSDLIDLLSEENNSTSKQFWAQSIGSRGRNRDKLRATSPARNAEQFQAPVLIVHGRDDKVVEYSQGRKMERVLKKAGKPVQLITLDGEDHGLTSSDSRIAALKAVDVFLKEHLDPGGH